MKNKIFEIREFSLIGKTLYTFLERKDVVFDESRKTFKDENGLIEPNHHYKLVIGLETFKKQDLFPAEIELLPYKAKVKQDLPTSVKKYLEPEEYLNCQLMSETHGGCLQFKNLDNGEVLRIAINSNIYTPL